VPEADTRELADVSSVTERVDAPTSWRRPARHRQRETLQGAGLGIFGLRRIPLVDRQEERDVLWDELRRCLAEERPRAVVLSGGSGYGKSRLVDWVARRGHETGAVSVLEARHERRHGPAQELGAMFARHFRCVGLEPIEVVRRMETVYERLGLTGSNAHHDIIGISDLMVSGRIGQGEETLSKKGFQSPAERNRALGRLLRRLSQRRPLLIAMHDAHLGEESLSLASFLLERTEEHGSAPIMLALTRPNHLDRDLEARHPLEQMHELPGVTQMTVDRLSDDAQQVLARDVLGLDPDVADEVVRRTEGNPMFAVQLVEDWIQRGELELGPRGFRSVEGAALDVPGDTMQMWERRIDRLVRSQNDSLETPVTEALETASAMGRGVTTDEWRAVCTAVGLERADAVVENLLLSGLAERYSGGWRFRHALLRECLERRSRGAGRWKACHLRCINVIGDLMDHRDVGYSIRLAGHLLAAGETDRALPHLLDGIDRARQAGAYEKAASLLERREHVLDRYDCEESCRFRIQNWIAHGELLTATGRDEDARKWSERAVKTARRQGLDAELAHALRLRAGLRRESSSLDGALDDIEASVELFGQLGDPRGQAHARYVLARIQQMRGELSDAEASYVESMEYFDGSQDDSMRALITCDIGYNWVTQGREDEARRAFEISRELAQKVGNRRVAAKCWNRLGEIARFSGDLQEARRAYRTAEELFRVPGNQHVASLNLSLVEIADQRYDAARSVLSLLESAFDPAGAHSPPLQMGLACCAAAAGAWEQWAKRFDRCQNMVSGTGLVHADLPWLAERVGTIAEDKGHTDRARRAFQFAAEHAASLGNREEANRLSERLDTLQ
jgi:tetratricopeptide (TPR) repeat protein